ncbi:hypothetical protein Plhal304r1_c054g0139031 [Plasmopara halstedii]
MLQTRSLTLLLLQTTSRSILHSLPSMLPRFQASTHVRRWRKCYETSRRDNAEAEAARRRVEASKPLASRLYELPRAKYDVVIDTSQVLAKAPLQKIMVSLAGKHHGNDVFEPPYGEFAIGQVSRLPGGNLRVKGKTKEAILKLERTKYTWYKYFIDIANVDSDTSTDVILHRLFLLRCKPVYDSFREINLMTGITSAT